MLTGQPSVYVNSAKAEQSGHRRFVQIAAHRFMFMMQITRKFMGFELAALMNARH